MSLINKMLQDLDARGGVREDGLQQRELKAVPAPEHQYQRRLLLAGAGVGVVALVAVAGWYGWQAMQRSAPGPVPVMAAAAAVPPVPSPALVSAADAGAAASSTSSTLSTTSPVTAPASNLAAGSEALPGPIPEAAPATGARSAAADALAPAQTAPAAGATGRDRLAAAFESSQPRELRGSRNLRQASTDADSAGHVDANTNSNANRNANRNANANPNPNAKPELTPQQLSENTYRRALAALQDGRLSAAMADLDRALEIDPRNEAARQTYVTLLLENRRPDDAMRQLRLALGIDPRQPGLAMVLARLQLERGGPALETLMTSLPYAAANADYQALLAGVLQRGQRHAEAARYYQAALKLSPLNGVWWMGLGISLQADQHRAEAREAFTRARSGNGITPELLVFIDRRLDQLSRAVPQ